MPLIHELQGKHYHTTWIPSIVDGQFSCPICDQKKPVSEMSKNDSLYCKSCEPGVLANRRMVSQTTESDPRDITEKPITFKKRQRQVVSKLRGATSSRPDVSKRSRGRPRKEGRVSRVTTWRRAKQGRLI